MGEGSVLCLNSGVLQLDTGQDLLEQLILRYRDHLCPILIYIKWSAVSGLLSPQAAHSFFLDSGGVPYRWFLDVVTFGDFLGNRVWILSQLDQRTESNCENT